MLNAISAFALVQIAGLAPSSQEVAPRFLSDRVAVRVRQDGATDLDVYDAVGEVVRTVALGDRIAIPGIGNVALVGRPDGSGARSVEILASDGDVKSRLTIAENRRLTLGRTSLALSPHALHSPGTEFSVEFLSLQGKVLAKHQIPEVVLLGIDADPGGHFIASSMDSEVGMVRVYDSEGQALWAFRGEHASLPQACVAPSGRHAAVWSISDDRSTSTLHLVDGRGTDLVQLEVDALHSAVYSEDESVLLLAGWDALIIIDVPTNQVLWTSTAPLNQPLGPALLISADGRRADLLTRPAAGATHPGLRTIWRLDATNFKESYRELSEIADFDRVLGLTQLDDGGLSVVIATGQWRIAQ